MLRDRLRRPPDGRARRWTRRRATRLAARVGADPRCAGVTVRRVGLWRWQINYWLDLDAR